MQLLSSAERAAVVKMACGRWGPLTVRPIDFSDHHCIEELTRLHDTDAARLRWPGVVARRHEYWHRWVGAIMGDVTPARRRAALLAEGPDGRMLGYLLAAIQHTTITVGEFAARGGDDIATGALAALLDSVIETCAPSTALTVQGLAAIFGGAEARGLTQQLLGVAGENVQEWSDPEWMVRVVSPFMVGDTKIANNDDLLAYCAADSRMPAWWDADSF